MSFAEDQVKWKRAQLKIAWRYHQYLFVALQLIFWIIWFFSDARDAGIPWTLLIFGGWLIVLLLHYILYKIRLHQLQLTAKEFEKEEKL
jgi:hypothetical protein